MSSTRTNRGWAAVMVAATLTMLAAAIAAPAQTFTTLHTFDLTDGAGPVAPLVQATDGNLYGTTSSGGSIVNPYYGTVFKVTPTGSLTTLYSFCPHKGCKDGKNPEAGFVQAKNGSFYGTTSGGGANNDGTIFKIAAGGVLTPLHSFDSTDGTSPVAALIQATDGNFYGTTVEGGPSPNNAGTVFKITPAGTLTTLYDFCSQSGCTDGDNPYSGLVEGADGNFYGTTSLGGSTGGPGETYGTIFRITPSGILTTLYSFCSQTGCTDGLYPQGQLIQGSDGNFYGTTIFGGSSTTCAPGCGTAFKITPSGKLTTLHSFDDADGLEPYAGLVEGTDGNFYGTTYFGGANGYGTIFKLTRRGTLTTLYNFCSQSACSDGGYPAAALVQDTNGKFYGTTCGTGCDGGGSGDGSIFSLDVGLGLFVEPQSTSGKVGVTVNILGTNLTGASSVTFNGTAATFTVESASYIQATVPTGATTGPVQVVTPSGTLTSNVNFRVEP